MSNLNSGTSDTNSSNIYIQKHSSTSTVYIDKNRLKYLLDIEKKYTQIIAAGVKQEIKKENTEKKETVLRDP
jgi:hypothetical protein